MLIFFILGGTDGGSGREQCASPPVGGGSGSGSGSATPTRITGDEEIIEIVGGGGIPVVNLDSPGPGEMSLDVTVARRYAGLESIIEHMVMEIVREQLNRR